MKFRFCGEADCPDWLLMQINTLTKLSPSQLEGLVELVAQPLTGAEINYQKLAEFSKAASLDLSETKACVSAVTQVLESGSCYGVSPGDLGQELEQLGLDRSHSQLIVRTYARDREEITSRLKSEALRVGRLAGITASPAGASVRLTFDHTHFSGKGSSQTISMTKEQCSMLLKDLKQIRSRMEDLQPE